MIKKFDKFFESQDRISRPQLKYYAMDWDDNILFMPTKIHMDRLEDGEWVPEDVSTAKFAEIRKDSKYRILNDDPDQAFSEFRDNGPRGEDAFLNDVQEAIKTKRFGPSWNDFIEALTNGSLFAIVTARGHDPAPMRKAVEWIIDTQLSDDQKNNMAANLNGFLSAFDNTDIIQDNRGFEELKDYYLDSCDYYGVSSPSFMKIFPGSASDPEEAKKAAITLFAKKVEKFGKDLDADVHLGFSDDDPGNVEAIQQLFKDEPSLHAALDYYIYDTSSEKERVHTFESFNESNNEDEEDEDATLCGICGGDASICDGC